MRNSLVKIIHTILSLLVVVSVFATASGQSGSCDVRAGGSIGFLAGSPDFRLAQFCSTAPADLLFHFGSNDGTCRNCFPGNTNYGPNASKGGSANCTMYDKQLIIDFSQPVADVDYLILGARTVTDNRGITINMNPPLYPSGAPMDPVVAHFEGGGITRLIITDPIVYDVYNPNGSLDIPGFWQIDGWDVEFTPGSTYDQCNCGRPTIPAPPTQNVSSGWPFDLSGVDPNWSMLVQMTPNDGLVLRDVKLGQRYMVEKINVPYYYLETSALPKTRGELRPDGSETSMRSRLVNFTTNTDDTKLVIEATYVIDQIPAGSPSCLEITQRYEFYRTKAGDNCEPSAKLPCSRWKPIVKYRFTGQNSETLQSINIAQRQHRKVDNNVYDTVGLFRDNDTLKEFVTSGPDIFGRKWNPLESEWYDQIIRGGKDSRKWDNVHETYMGRVEEPLINPGCPECVHSHWRWGALTGILLNPEGDSNLIGVPEGSNQDIDLGVVAYQSGEEHPLVPYNDLVNGLVQYWQPIRTHNTAGRNPLQIYRDSAPEDVVYWQSGTGYQNSDTFFAYGGFFNPTLPSQQLYGGLGGMAPRSNGLVAFGDYASVAATDDITSITATQIFASGNTTISAFNASLGGPLPAGYSQYSTLSFDVTTTAESSGPDTVTFSVPSVTDQTVFDNLRVFHLEQDPYDPDGVKWVDRTVLAPDPQAPDFANKTINARANFLGQYVVASLTQPQPPNTGVADISVSTTDSPDGVIVGNDLTYTLTVTNSGPQSATGVVFSNSLSPQTRFVSVNSTQGTCKETDGTVVCKLAAIAASSNATITIVVRPAEDAAPFPTGGKVISDTAFAKANESDPNPNNNSATENTTVLPDGNAAPTVSVTSPTVGALFVGPANININAAAGDTDGSVSKVDFYGDGDLIGTSTVSPYSVPWNNISFGTHAIIAVATDNLNKTKVSDPVTFIVNGSAAVNITSPGNYSTFNRSANIPVTATATLSGGTISKVDFYLDGFISLGTGTLTGGQYSVTWNGATSGKHVLTAVATDNSNTTTTSSPVNVTVNEPPVISLSVPTGGAVFTPAPATVNITANASDWDGFISRVDFYANGSLVGTSTRHGVNQFTLSWSNVASGTYALTAIAVDDAGASTTSMPVSIRVNASPIVSITSPASSAQFTSPANITIAASSSDSDGSVTGVDFFANGYRMGSGTSIGGGQFSFAWNGVGVGAYTLSAKATDNDGAVTSSAGVNVTVTSPVLFVAGSTTLNSSDNAVKTRLEALNCTVTVKDAASATTADANGKALVVISSTVNPTSVGTKFRTVAVPVITWESGLFNNMGMTGSTNKDFGTKTSQTQVSVTNPTHPLAAGLSGTVTAVSASKTFDWGKPNANAITVATTAGDATKTAIFAYEMGAVMPGLTAPARRVGLFLYDDTAASFNSNGTALLDAAIRWARGGGSISASMVVSPVGLVNLTTGGVVDWAHWGLNGPTSFDHKGGVTQSISNFTKIGTGGLSWFTDCPTSFSWTDGTPTLSVSSTATGDNTNGSVGNGFEFTVPADTNVRTLKLYVGVWYTQGKLEASMIDGTAATFTDTALNNNGGASFGLYTINFKAGSTGQTMKIRFTILNQYFSSNGNVALEGATLQ